LKYLFNDILYSFRVLDDQIYKKILNFFVLVNKFFYTLFTMLKNPFIL